MIYYFAKKYNINLRKSYLIGYSDADILPGRLLNLKTILVENNKSKKFESGIKVNFNVKNLNEAVNLILKHKK